MKSLANKILRLGSIRSGWIVMGLAFGEVIALIPLFITQEIWVSVPLALVAALTIFSVTITHFEVQHIDPLVRYVGKYGGTTLSKKGDRLLPPKGKYWEIISVFGEGSLSFISSDGHNAIIIDNNKSLQGTGVTNELYIELIDDNFVRISWKERNERGI